MLMKRSNVANPAITQLAENWNERHPLLTRGTPRRKRCMRHPPQLVATLPNGSAREGSTPPYCHPSVVDELVDLIDDAPEVGAARP